MCQTNSFWHTSSVSFADSFPSPGRASTHSVHRYISSRRRLVKRQIKSPWQKYFCQGRIIIIRGATLIHGPSMLLQDTNISPATYVCLTSRILNLKPSGSKCFIPLTIHLNTHLINPRLPYFPMPSADHIRSFLHVFLIPPGSHCPGLAEKATLSWR